MAFSKLPKAAKKDKIEQIVPKYDKEKQKENKNEEEKRTYQANEKRIETTHQIGWQNNKVHNDIETKTTG